jgi:hypothetical protein
MTDGEFIAFAEADCERQEACEEALSMEDRSGSREMRSALEELKRELTEPVSVLASQISLPQPSVAFALAKENAAARTWEYLESLPAGRG